MFRSLFGRVFGNTGKPPLPLSYCWHPSCVFYDDVRPFLWFRFSRSLLAARSIGRSARKFARYIKIE
ncbi:hypothetical protein QR685DRAFT_573024 [Neurospora intermedia]|uniref:Uncharacterized protein n=1 Tax=Neurospora intermedia TaxID=5142 RepID=A0ABR3D7P7_NEUIN